MHSHRSLTVGATLSNEVSVEPVVDIDLHVVHPVNLQEEPKAGRQEKEASGPGTCWDSDKEPDIQPRKCQLLSFLSDCPRYPWEGPAFKIRSPLT